MQRGLLSNEKVNVNHWDTSSSLSSSSSEFDLLNINIRQSQFNHRREIKENHSVNSDSNICANHHQLLINSPEIGSSSGCRSTSLQSFHFSELTETRKTEPKSKILSMRKISHHRTKESRETEPDPQNTTKKVTFNKKANFQGKAVRRYDVVIENTKEKPESGKRSPRIRSPNTKTTEQAEKATQVQIGLDRQGKARIPDTDRSTTDTYRSHPQSPHNSARPIHSSENIGSSKPRSLFKASLSPRLPRQQCLHSNRRRPKTRMAQHRPSPRSLSQDYGKFPVESPATVYSGKDIDDSKRVFPFQLTPSGNLKIVPNQVVFESKKVSVLVADPKQTKVNVKAELGSKNLIEGQKSSIQVMNRSDNQFEMYRRGDGEFYHREMTDGDDASEELELERTKASTPIDWSKVILPNKSELYKLLHYRITNYINSDCVIHVGNEDFNCHHLVLQCYSSYFDREYFKEAELPESSVSPKVFSIIYDWMIHPGVDSYQLLRRDNILEIFMAAQFLGVKELEDQCWAFIDSDEMFSEDTAFLLYLKAKKIGNTAVMELMIPRIVKFFLTLVSSKDFLDLSVDELCIILKSNYISVHCEMEVFMSAVRWLMYDWDFRKKFLTEVMSCIRFGLIAPWQLVDIRRNPENPEFVEISSSPQVQQFVEDGLAFAIIKYWYGNQTQDYHHWIDILGLTEPTPRNWFEDDKNYVTYREFLRDLDIYRKTELSEKKRSKTTKVRQLQSLESQALPPMVQHSLPPQEGNSMPSRSLSMLPGGLANLIPMPSVHQNNDGERVLPSVTELLNRREYVSNQNQPSSSNSHNVISAEGTPIHRSASASTPSEMSKPTGGGDEGLH